MLLDRRLRRETVEADAKAYHVHLSLGETLDAGGVEDVAKDTLGMESVAKAAAPLGETVNLGMGEIIHCRVVGTGEVREDGLDTQGALGIVEAVGNFGKVGL